MTTRSLFAATLGGVLVTVGSGIFAATLTPVAEGYLIAAVVVVAGVTFITRALTLDAPTAVWTTRWRYIAASSIGGGLLGIGISGLGIFEQPGGGGVVSSWVLLVTGLALASFGWIGGLRPLGQDS